MKKTVKMSQIVNLSKELKDLQKETLPLKTKYNISKLLNAVDKEEAHFQSLRNGFIDQYGDNENAHDPELPPNFTIHQKSKNWPEFVKEIDALLKMEVEIESLSVTIEDIGDIKSDKPYHEIFDLLS